MPGTALNPARIVILILLCICAGHVSALAQVDFAPSLRAKSAGSYFEDHVDSRLGALYGLDLALPIFERSNFYGSFSHNHFDGGSQYLGTVGAFTQAMPAGTLGKRTSGGLLFDQFADTRFEGLYLSQLRYFLGFALSDGFAAGMIYTDPVAGEDTVSVRGAEASGGIARVRDSELFEAYLSLRWDTHLAVLTLGNQLDTDEFVGSLYALRQLNRQLGFYTNTTYSDGGTWATAIGLQWTFGNAAEKAPVPIATNDLPAVVRGQHAPTRANLYVDPALGIVLNLDANRFGSLLDRYPGSVTLSTVSNNTVLDGGPTVGGPTATQHEQEPHGGGFIGDSVTE